MSKDTINVKNKSCGFIAVEIFVAVLAVLYVFANMVFIRPVLWRSLPPLPNGSVVELLFAYTENNYSCHCLEYKLYIKNNNGEFYYWTGQDPYIADGHWTKRETSKVEEIARSLSQSKDPCRNYPDPPIVWWSKPIDSAKSCSDFARDLVDRIRHYVLLKNGRVLMAASNDSLPLLVYPATGLIILFLVHFVSSVIVGFSRR